MKQAKSKHSRARFSAEHVHFLVSVILKLVLTIGLILAIRARLWQDVFTISCIILLMLAPSKLGHRYRIQIPPEFGLMAILFVFASMFLGELHGFYVRYWWWDIALHTTSGLLLGIFGFLLVYILNEDGRIELKLHPSFVALFAFMFAVAFGVLWEIFEFSMDQLFGMNMQKPMGGDASGLTDTMWDLIVDMVGAGIVTLTGWWHLKMGKRSVFDGWIQKFIAANPRLFKDSSKRDQTD